MKINTSDSNGIQELINLNTRLDKTIQNLNGDIFEIIETKSENLGLL